MTFKSENDRPPIYVNFLIITIKTFIIKPHVTHHHLTLRNDLPLPLITHAAKTLSRPPALAHQHQLRLPVVRTLHQIPHQSHDQLQPFICLTVHYFVQVVHDCDRPGADYGL